MTRSMRLCRDASIVCAINGFPPKARTFLPGTPFEPLRAGISPRTAIRQVGRGAMSGSLRDRQIAFPAHAHLVIAARRVQVPDLVVGRAVPDVAQRLVTPVADDGLVLVVDAADRDIAVVLEKHALERLGAMEAFHLGIIALAIAFALDVVAVADRIDEVLPHHLHRRKLLHPFRLLVHDHGDTDLAVWFSLVA